MGKITGYVQQYTDQVLIWYYGLEQLYQMSVLFLVIVSVLFLFAYLALSRFLK